ncbi:hypothetical protein [Segatella paludivivens]|uniref:hypothetical protein n=1 Tax=Segatella paludivivens TaxID=185294 RepID=UPI00037FAA55|nr:hypothetical protein [Segatella paludivivens]
MSITIEQADSVIKSLNQKNPEWFSSHEFIGRYIKMYEYNYIDMLVEYMNTHTLEIFKTVHTQIANFLSANQDKLGIYLNGEVIDMNIHYLETRCKKWNIKPVE